MANQTGSNNTASGFNALRMNTEGSWNTAIGTGALMINSTGIANVATGNDTLRFNSTGSWNTALGFGALSANTTGQGNVGTGHFALKLTTSGHNNTADGTNSLLSNTTGNNNTALGAAALTVSTTAHGNTAIGGWALEKNTTGENNTALGYKAGSNQTTGSNNLYINHVGVAGESGTIRVGIPGTQARTFLAGVTGVPVAGSNVIVDTDGQFGVLASSRRFKDSIEDMGKASQALSTLRPVTFRYKTNIVQGNAQREYGLIAEEVAEVYPELVGHNVNGEPITVRYDQLIPMLLNEVQRQQRHIEELQKVQEDLKAVATRLMKLEHK